jgi:hypothetical protein
MKMTGSVNRAKEKLRALRERMLTVSKTAHEGDVCELIDILIELLEAAKPVKWKCHTCGEVYEDGGERPGKCIASMAPLDCAYNSSEAERLHVSPFEVKGAVG